MLLIVPSSLRDQVLFMNHDTRDSGHLGQLNTYLRVKKSFYWFRLRNCVYNCVSTCAKCKTNKQPHRRHRAGLGQYHVEAPMDRVMIDVLGPLLRAPRGNSIILMLIDQGVVSIRKTVLLGMAIPMLKIRRPNGRLIFNMEITIRR